LPANPKRNLENSKTILLEEPIQTNRLSKQPKILTDYSEVHKFLDHAACKLQPLTNIDDVLLDTTYNVNELIQRLIYTLIAIHNTCENLTFYFDFGKILKLLKSNWVKANHQTSFSVFCTENFDLGKSTINHYIKITEFLTKYPKFKRTGLNWSFVRDKSALLKKWFTSVQATELPDDSVLSPQFWK
jgi:hypothetical protein